MNSLPVKKFIILSILFIAFASFEFNCNAKTAILITRSESLEKRPDAVENFLHDFVSFFRNTGRYDVYDASDLKYLKTECRDLAKKSCANVLHSLKIETIIFADINLISNKLFYEFKAEKYPSKKIIAEYNGEVESETCRLVNIDKPAKYIHKELLKTLSNESEGYEIGALEPTRIYDYSWFAASGALVTALAATFVSLNANNAEESFQDKLKQSMTKKTSASELVNLKERAQNEAILANCMWGVTGVFALSTVILFVIEASNSPSEVQMKQTLITAAPIKTNVTGFSLSLEF